MINFNKDYRNIFILESRSFFQHIAKDFDPKKDLVLTFDFGLRRETEILGGDACYIDSLCSPQEMQENNFLASEFFKKWHYDANGNDIFTVNGVPFGFAFRIEIWNEYLYYVRLRANLTQLGKLKYNEIYLGESDNIIGTVLDEMKIDFNKYKGLKKTKKNAYYFDVHKYMSDALRGSGLRGVARNFLIWLLSNVSFYLDKIFKLKSNQKIVYVQHYHPTSKIIEHLRQDANLKVITPSLIPIKGLNKYFVQRLIPIGGKKLKYQQQSRQLLNDLKLKRSVTLFLSDGTDITAGALNVIENKIYAVAPQALRVLNSVNQYIDNNPIHLEILIANLGLTQTIVDCVLKTKQVPSYLIINGILGGQFGDEGKYATYINGYSENIKKHYFSDAENVVCLGDPRMDVYASKMQPKAINRLTPTVTIGASGFNGINLISHVAVEFDFMFDLLTAFSELRNEGNRINLIIKVRANGVLEQYTAFAREYFTELPLEIVRDTPINHILNKTDFYISIYSQTLLEASCLGIPVVYYKKDREFLDPPFDSNSELVTVNTVTALKQAFHDFKAGHARYDRLLDKTVMEKYIGPLDGKNLERNLNFIYALLSKSQSGAVH